VKGLKSTSNKKLVGFGLYTHYNLAKKYPRKFFIIFAFDRYFCLLLNI